MPEKICLYFIVKDTKLHINLFNGFLIKKLTVFKQKYAKTIFSGTGKMVRFYSSDPGFYPRDLEVQIGNRSQVRA